MIGIVSVEAVKFGLKSAVIIQRLEKNG